MTRTLGHALLLSSLVGCGVSSMQPRFEAPAAPTEQVVAQRIPHAPERKHPPRIVGVSETKDRILGWDIEGNALWSVEARVKSAPLIAGSCVVLEEEDGITVRDLHTGALRTTLSSQGRLVGADGDDNRCVITLSLEGTDVRGQVALVEGSSVRFRKNLALTVGTPALSGDLVLLPWATQRLSVLDVRDGTELSRLSFPQMVVAHARVDRGRVFIGQHGFAQVSAELPTLSETLRATISPTKRRLPGQPPLVRDGYAPVAEVDGAENRLAVDYALPAPDAADAAADHDLLLLRFYRIAFGLSAARDEVRWVKTFDADLVGGRVDAGGAVLLDATGKLHRLDGQGNAVSERDLGARLAAAAVLVDAGQAKAQAGETPPKGEASLHDELLAAANLADDRLGPARAYAVEKLAALGPEPITGELITLCADRRIPPAVSLAACDGLAKRERGAEAVLQALAQHGSFLEATPVPPVGALARAAKSMQLRKAAPLLLSHADDPHTPAPALVPLFETLAALEHRSASSSIERFLRLHHAEPEGSEMRPALEAALSAIAALRAPSGRRTIEEVSQDLLTPAPLRQLAREALGVYDAPPAKPAPEPAPATAAKAEPQAEAPPVDHRPWTLDASVIEATIKPTQKSLERCLSSDPSAPKSGRISLIVLGDGSVENAFVTPKSLQTCIEPQVRALKFPETRRPRQQITHAVRSSADDQE